MNISTNTIMLTAYRLISKKARNFEEPVSDKVLGGYARGVIDLQIEMLTEGNAVVGVWKENEHDHDFYQCSNCGCNWDKGTVENCNMDYCPNCGTKMMVWREKK